MDPSSRHLKDTVHHQDIDTSGSLSSANALIGGILGIAGAPTFQRGKNVIEVIKKDHEKVSAMYSQYESTTDIEQRRTLSHDIIKDIVQHSEVEQALVYPLLKYRVPQGRKDEDQFLHDRSLSEHQNIRELLYEVDHTDVDDASHPQKMKRAIDAVLEHVKEEETEVLPELEKNYTVEELERLGNAFEIHKNIAVTHPHPSAPLQGPFATAANLMTKPIDLARDAVENLASKV